jgi:MYXO-CTERM domain-containing protein
VETYYQEVNMKPQDKMSGFSEMDSRRQMNRGRAPACERTWMRLTCTMILGALLCCAQAGVALAASVTISLQNATAVANDTAHVPVTIQLASELTTGDVSVNLQVIAQGGAPAVGKLTFTDGDLGSESAFNNDTAGIYIGTWFSKPQTGGTINLGTLDVPIPESAQSGDTYQVFIQTAEVDQPDGSTPYDDINFSSTALITVGGPPVTPATETPTPQGVATDTPTTAPTNTPTTAPTNTPTTGPPTATPTATATSKPGTATATPVPTTVLTKSVGASDTCIPVANTSIFSSSGGYAYIGSEFIHYGGIGTSCPGGASAVGVAAATSGALIDVTRNLNGQGSSHEQGTTVAPAAAPAPSCPSCDDDDGCQIGVAGQGSAWLLLIPAVALLAVKRRRR